MSDQRSPEPSDDDLVAFASKLLGGEGKGFAEEDVLRETVNEARNLWLLLYHAYPDEGPEP